MEQRKHPRVQLPLLVELKHPALQLSRHIARDISEGGVFVHMQPPPSISAGAKMRLTLLDPIKVENQPSPTVEVQVVRVEQNGLGVEFVNKTSRHLWESVERLRNELAIGRDYFQVHQSALVFSQTDELLIVQQNGRWGFPGHFLVVGDDWRQALQARLSEQIGLTTAQVQRIFSGESTARSEIPEAAIYRVFILVKSPDAAVTLLPDGPYSDYRWLARPRELEALTFGSELLRQQAADALEWMNAKTLGER